MKLHKEKQNDVERILNGFNYDRNSVIIKGQNNSFL